MTNKEAIKVILANYPPENNTLLREALALALKVLSDQEAIQESEALGDM